MAEFGTLNLEEMAGEDARLANEGGAGAGGFLDQFVPMPEVKPGQTGSVAVRILPPIKGGKLFQYNRTHKINNRSVHCPRPLVNGKWERNVPCPICDYYSSLWKQIEKIEKQFGKDCPQAEALKAEARELKPVERYYYNAVVRTMVVDNKEIKNVGPRILSVGKILHSMIIKAIVGNEGDPDSKLGNIADLKNGYDFIIRKAVTLGQDGFPKYDSSGFARNPSPAGTPEEVAKWAASLHDLTKLRNPKDVDYLEKELAIHRGLIADETESMDIETFDAKWGKKASDEVQEMAEQASNRTQVSVPEGVPSSKPVVTKTESLKVSAPPSEDLSIEDEDFLKELEGMEG
jgi:hypothetical protein